MSDTRFKKGQTPWNKTDFYINCAVCGIKVKIQKHQIGRKKYCSLECAYKGQKYNNSGLFKKGHNDVVPISSRGHSAETRNKISKTNIQNNNSGVKSWNWKGGISKVDKLCRRMPEYLIWRSNCFERDNWTCQNCNISGVYLTVHHKKSFSKILKENNINNIIDARNCYEIWDTNNGITLCENCHSLTDNYKGRGINRE